MTLITQSPTKSLTTDPIENPAKRLQNVQTKIEQAAYSVKRNASDINLIAVSKTHDEDKIRQLINLGHRVFGENRVQEAQSKWPKLKHDYPETELHLIGPLQSNKTKDAVALFDAIHTVDRSKIAKTLKDQMEVQNKKLKLFIQVNTGEEQVVLVS